MLLCFEELFERIALKPLFNTCANSIWTSWIQYGQFSLRFTFNSNYIYFVLLEYTGFMFVIMTITLFDFIKERQYPK